MYIYILIIYLKNKMSNLDLSEEAKIQRQKMNYFYSKVKNNDFEQAIQYLILADWDERKAVEIYMNRHKNQNIQNNSNPNNNNRNIPSQNNNNNNRSNINPMPHQHQQHSSAPQIYAQSTLDFHINDMFLKNNVTFKSKDKVQYSNFVIDLNQIFPFIAKSLKDFLILLKDHAGIAILIDSNKFEQVKVDLRKVKRDSLCLDIVKSAVLFPIMKDSILGNELVNQLSCISFPSYIFCKYKSQNDIKINGRMEGTFHCTLLIDKLLNSLPDSQSDLRSSLRKNLHESIMNNIINNDYNNNDNFRNNINRNNYNNSNINNNNNNNYNNNNNNNNNNNDYFGQHNQDFFLGDTQEMNKLIEQLSKNDINDINNNQNNNSNLNNNNRNNNNNVNNRYLNNNNHNNNYNNNHNNIPNNNINVNDSIAGLSYGQILAKRENEMKELERQHEEKMKKEEEEKRKEEEKKRKEMEEENKLKKLEEKYNKEAEFSKNLLPPEPDENNPDACTIVLRYPDCVKTMERRFLKTDKINSLFIFVKSKGREIFSEREYNNFELIFGLPPKNLENSKDKTLEEEGMFPNGIINIKEKL